ncbi:Cytochrome b5 reductase 4 [Frankliniella fusca]|uniref:Cytochrome b5 reductase 4 n=1 Tax=Frankliniella fusca TaxID=407009 RepID=A0AAE1GXB7_9NEOP|nr:Cytochrome b5 reductase 4 [Frankliniella fusca]
MDWIRLGNSGADLTGVGGRLQDVGPEQLAQHCRRDDAWLAIRGNVYNVTPYMNFHPGGVEELERGIGTDATKLFSQVHAWVNYDSILKKCLVGRYRPRSGEGSSPTSPEVGLGVFLATKEEKEKHNVGRNTPTQPPPRKLRYDWYEQEERGSIVLYCQTQEPSVKVTLGEDNKDLLLLVCEKGEIQSLHILLENDIVWPPRLIQIPNSSKVELQLKKSKPGHWKTFGHLLQENNVPSTCLHYSKMKVNNIFSVNYNTKILALSYLDQTFSTTPVGHHVRVRNVFDGEEIERCYTPICKSMVEPQSEEDQTLIYLMVKKYETGLLSSWLASRSIDDILEVSSPEGSFQTSCLINRKELYLFAAGTGFTPMVGVINFARKIVIGKCTKISLTFFNRTEKDILWKDELERLVQKDSRFTVSHVLSEADETWTGLRGRVDGELLRSQLPSRNPQDEPKAFVFVCGPTAFTQLTGGLLTVMGYTNKDYHCFQG